MIEIREPIWKDRSIGLSLTNLDKEGDETIVEIVYKNKNRQRIFPNSFKISTAKAKAYPMMTRKNETLFLIPISELEEIKPQELDNIRDDQWCAGKRCVQECLKILNKS